MIKKMIIAMLAICASAMVFTSCGDDDDDDNPSSNNQSGKTTWAKIVNEHSWLSIFPEYPGYIDNDIYLNQGAMESETITVTGRNQSEFDSYFSKISKLKGFEKSWDDSEYFYEYEDDVNDITYIVQGMYMETMGVKTSQITFSIIKD